MDGDMHGDTDGDPDGDVLVVGESLVDIVRASDGTTLEYAGGSAANVAVALARLGRRVRFATAWADDDRGAVLAAHLDRAGVELAGDPRVLERTATAAATIGADGAASYEFDLEWRLGEVAAEPAPLVVHACSLGAVVQPGADQVRDLVGRLRTTATVSYDVNARPAITGTGPDVAELVERMVALSDVVKASDEDLASLYPQLPLAAAAGALLDLGPAAVVVTRGGDGATWFGHGAVVEVASLPVEVADTIGAGDTFSAAVIDALWERGRLGAAGREALRDLPADEVAEVLAHAARAAAVTVSRPGADPPYRSEL
jgi:fructokinase